MAEILIHSEITLRSWIAWVNMSCIISGSNWSSFSRVSAMLRRTIRSTNSSGSKGSCNIEAGKMGRTFLCKSHSIFNKPANTNWPVLIPLSIGSSFCKKAIKSSCWRRKIIMKIKINSFDLKDRWHLHPQWQFHIFVFLRIKLNFTTLGYVCMYIVWFIFNIGGVKYG